MKAAKTARGRYNQFVRAAKTVSSYPEPEYLEALDYIRNIWLNEQSEETKNTFIREVEAYRKLFNSRN